MHTIKNEFLEISVKQSGAELCSIKSVESGKEFMWDANPKIWGSSSPVLFPIVGGLKNNCFFYKENSYNLPRHGFVRNNDSVFLREEKSDGLVFSLKHDEETLKKYPFKFDFTIGYTLKQNKIIVNYKVFNEGNEIMFFSLGAHPAFRCPINEGEVYEDYFLEFEKEETSSTWLLDDNGQVTGLTAAVLKQTKILRLYKGIFEKDALIFKDLKSRKVSLKSKKSTSVITINFSGFPYLGIWAKPDADFVCIEPWLGIADSSSANQDLETKEGIIELGSKNFFEIFYEILIEE